ncbi:MAG TPA: SEC-C metal-binding domain-containing protein, partial [Ktedonobacterales bacterium]|nr:SEC-C metal-binding domain-containing protein [Ktedonobacterales bacterium]
EDELMRRFGTDRAAGIMQRFGMDDDMPLEAAMVSRMIDQAQSKVEGFNFDIRKNVVEYDDVIAKQREVIYEDRQAVLAREDMHERCLEMIEHEVARVVRAHTTANMPEDWDLEGIVRQFDAWGVRTPDDFFPEQINRLRREPLTADFVELAQEGYANKEAQIIKLAKENNALESGEVYMRQFERMVVLQVVDGLWQEHLDSLDVMRSGIGWRGMAQRDPLNEFKSEAFKAFEDLKVAIEHHVVDLLFRGGVNITLPEPPQQALPQNLRTNAEDIAKLSGQAKGVGAATTAAAARAVATKNQSNGNGQQPRGQNDARPAQGAGNKHGSSARHANLAKSGASASRPQPRQPALTSAAQSSGNMGKVGRNDLCPCGSGKKYKACHGR